jgi:hypothetical protein
MSQNQHKSKGIPHRVLCTIQRAITSKRHDKLLHMRPSGPHRQLIDQLRQAFPKVFHGLWSGTSAIGGSLMVAVSDSCTSADIAEVASVLDLNWSNDGDIVHFWESAE